MLYWPIWCYFVAVVSRRNKWILFSLGLLVISETYIFGFGNSNAVLFSADAGSRLVLAGVLLILVLAIVLFVQQFIYLRNKKVRNEKPDTESPVPEKQPINFPEKISEVANEVASEHIEPDSAEKTEQVLTADAIENMQAENLLSDAELQTLYADINTALANAEQLLNNFSIEVYAHGKEETYSGMQAAAIHLNRIPILYNDLKQFRGNFTGYDRRLTEVLQVFSNALFNYQTLATQNTVLRKELEDNILELYNAQLKELVFSYRGMINRLYQKQAIDLFEPVVQILKNIREVITPIEADHQSV